MRATVLAIALLMSGCAAPPRAPSLRPLPARVSVERPSVQCEPVQPPPRELGPNLCLPNGLPKAPPEEDMSDGATCVERPALARRVAHKLAKSYQRVANGRVDVSFDCDPLTGVVTEIVIESGYGHGGSLQLWRLTRSGDEDAPFDVSGIAHDTFYMVGADDERRALPLLAKGAIPAKDIQPALDSTRALLTADVREMEPPPKPNSIGLHAMFFSSGNFHHHFRLRDGFRHQLARGYSGYPNSDGQRRYLPIRHAMEHLAPVLDRFEFVRGAPSPELRTWFSAYIVSAWPRLQDSDAWWVRERLVNLAAKVGDASVVPIIVSELARGVREVEKSPADQKRDRAERHLSEPLAALTAATGWDPRKASDGTARAPHAAAKLAIAECTRATW